MAKKDRAGKKSGTKKVEEVPPVEEALLEAAYEEVPLAEETDQVEQPAPPAPEPEPEPEPEAATGDSLREALRFPGGPVSLSAFDARATPLGPNGKKAALEDLVEHGDRLDELQERFYAEGTAGGERRVLLVLQGMDTSGKGGVIKHVIGMVNPQGVHIKSFKKPTPEEERHHFLWRVRREVPRPGYVGIFDRSHYEDVLIVRVHDLVPKEQWERRYAEINRFEQQQVNAGVTVVKCFLHISYDEQRARLLARLDDPTKHWKFNPSDVDERRHWDDYMAAYEAVLERCHSDVAPWYVIPADRKWYRNWAISRILLETLSELDPRYPRVRFRIDTQRHRLDPPH